MSGRVTRFLRDGYSAPVSRVVQATAIGLLTLAVCGLIAFVIIWAVATFL
ncbi:hypothetical protein G4X40_00400 [Rhodococcus sp. D2-41]|uniref:Uncharacterized protein n=1 Tax=Speluncibacter jeojiensis TaxID=2710754 RepID=A0A9X4LXN9_9ACTN|nr:hypothetical protein [Rhodococcus sp. D2-41]MDG3008609.1 hypothetical protein [Rhodococcus sp. D2-41]MDG3013184.1 hypothetical protein [Corynebacteriales bacterium D3-21]